MLFRQGPTLMCDHAVLGRKKCCDGRWEPPLSIWDHIWLCFPPLSGAKQGGNRRRGQKIRSTFCTPPTTALCIACIVSAAPRVLQIGVTDTDFTAALGEFACLKSYSLYDEI